MANNTDAKSLITCVICCAKFESPVILPCGDTICKKHLTDDEAFNKPKFICIFCDEEHKLPSGKANCFPPNKAIEKLLEMNLDKLDLGKAHRNAKVSFGNLSSKLDVFVHLHNDPIFYINEYFSDLINKIDLSREQVLLKINDFYDKMISDLKYNQTVCEQTALNSNKTEVCKRNSCYLSHLKKILNKWDTELNTIDFGGDKKWKNIDSEAKKLIDNIQFKIDLVKKSLLLNTSYDFKTNEIFIDPEWFGQLSITTNERPLGFSKEIIAFNRHLIEKDNYSYYKLIDYQELIGTWEDLTEFKQDEWNSRLRQFNETNLKLDESNFESLFQDQEQNDHVKHIIESEKKYSPGLKKSYNVVIWDNMWDFGSPDSFVFDYFVPVFKILNPEYQHEFKNDLGFGLFFRNAIFQRISKFGQE